MARIFELDAETLQIYSDALDDMFDLRAKNCRLIYKPKMENCSNCVADPIGKKSSNRYLHGGPIPFPNGSICPLCNGTSKKAIAQEENIRLAIEWSPARFVKPLPNLVIPDGSIQTKGYVSDIPKIKRSIEMVAQTPMEPYIRYKFKLLGEPVDIFNILQNKFFYCLWERV